MDERGKIMMIKEWQQYGSCKGDRGRVRKGEGGRECWRMRVRLRKVAGG